MTSNANSQSKTGASMSTKPHSGVRNWNAWPVCIIMFFAFAILGAASFIAFCNLHKTDLVSADYYEQELRYQSQMERAQRGQALGEQAAVGYDAVSKRITLEVPAYEGQRLSSSEADFKLKGTIHLYRPSAAGMDRHIKLQVDEQGRQAIDAGELSPGLWKVKILWTAGGQDYFIDRKVVIPARS